MLSIKTSQFSIRNALIYYITKSLCQAQHVKSSRNYPNENLTCAPTIKRSEVNAFKKKKLNQFCTVVMQQRLFESIRQCELSQNCHSFEQIMLT